MYWTEIHGSWFLLMWICTENDSKIFFLCTKIDVVMIVAITHKMIYAFSSIRLTNINNHPLQPVVCTHFACNKSLKSCTGEYSKSGVVQLLSFLSCHSVQWRLFPQYPTDFWFLIYFKFAVVRNAHVYFEKPMLYLMFYSGKIYFFCNKTNRKKN